MELTTDVYQPNISSYNNTIGDWDTRRASFFYSVTLSVIGLIGNSHALIINFQRFRSERKQSEKNPYVHVVFVLSLTILDMFTSLVILPMDNADLAQQSTPFSDGVCKFFRYLQFVIHVSSVLHIVLISIHCWRKVCHPFSWQINSKYAIRICLFFDTLSIAGAVIVVFLSGVKPRTRNGLTLTSCHIGETSKDPLFLHIAMGIFSFLFLVCLFIICACHFALIYNRLCRKKQGSNHFKDESLVQRTIVILIILTVLFLIAYIPFMVLAIMKAVDKGFQSNLTGSSAAAHGIFIRFPLLNNVVNPFMYGLKDAEFRKRLLKMYPCLKRFRKEEVGTNSHVSLKET